jgi:two-component system response regulator YesN
MYKLLIVDDEPVIRSGIRQLIDFAAIGIGEVLEAMDGETALKMVREHHPEIVLADINMPRMDGLALAKAIKALDRKTRVAIITGYDYFDYALTALKAGVDDFVLKPLSKNDVQMLLAKLVAAYREEDVRDAAMLAVEKLQLMTVPGGGQSRVYKDVMMRCMDENLSDPSFGLGVLAKAVNLSPGYLSSLFKQIFGIPFQDWLVTARLERAKILLLTTSAKVYEIAAQVGFEDPNHFIASFRKHFSQTPNRFRDATQGGLE